ncbi:MAG: 50S ribosomal protein L10 [Candidatus Melainabacteria bacterium]|jgi:large subunit ribosomal protein L10|nr:50S ribosomal protein L10 [Candidatus Melainabacteria bacterium]MBX9672754.1 50S ribosomal protein L10 [Candidatus Obscuribacterales bacterium]
MPTKEHKAGVISDLEQFFANGKVAIVADLSGYTVAELTQFRRTLDSNNAKVRVTKNTLVKIATKDGEFKAIDTVAKGPTTVVVGYDDPASPAKSVVEFIKKTKKGAIKGGVLEGKALSVEDVKGLADLPSKEQLLSSIMGGLDSGARNIAGIMESLIRDIALLAEEVAKKNNN